MPIVKRAQLIVLLLFTCSMCLTAGLALPTKTKSVYQATTASTGKPTSLPLVKRYDPSDQDNLDLYQDWASMCRQSNNNNIAMIAVDQNSTDSDNLSLNNLWKTVTQTVNCGGGHALTVTKTITATSTATPSSKPSKSGNTCTGQCWSDYLWRK